MDHLNVAFPRFARNETNAISDTDSFSLIDCGYEINWLIHPRKRASKFVHSSLGEGCRDLGTVTYSQAS
jgi:hypothetical protein